MKGIHKRRKAGSRYLPIVHARVIWVGMGSTERSTGHNSLGLELTEIGVGEEEFRAHLLR